MHNQQFSALFIFECAARHLSFTKTAEELCLTPSAVSHRIKTLEQQLGFSLFHRIGRQLSLSEEGHRLFVLLTQMIRHLDQEITDIQRNELSGSISVLVRPSIGQCWLIPRLTSFRKLYPMINLDIRTGNDNVDFLTQPMDVVIYYTKGEFPGLDSLKLMDEIMVPVCSPEYAQTHDLTGKLENLQNCTFLHDASAWPQAVFDIEWRLWLQSFYPALTDIHHDSITFDSSELSVIAAMNHAGIAIGRLRTLQRRLNSGELITPFGDKMLPSPCSYYLVFPRTQFSPRQKVFVEWLQAQAALSMA
jgi:LysR family D-serine deaminase transcriptional activator